MAFLDYPGLQRFKSKLNAIFETKMNADLKGSPNGVAELDSAGKVPSSQLPSYVDDVVEYNSRNDFPLTGETGKIYIDTSTNLSYRWSGSTYVAISASAKITDGAFIIS